MSVQQRKAHSTAPVDEQHPDTASLLQGKKAAEKTKSKFLVRLVVGWILIFITFFVLFSAHIYVALCIIGLQVLTFRELVSVRYNAVQSKPIPMFRTIQWCWFSIAMFYSYGDAIKDYLVLHGGQFKALGWYTRYHDWITFVLYSTLFAITILHLKKGSYRYQMGQLTWTLLTIGIFVMQIKKTMTLIFGGMFWFLLSASLIVCNDTFAYFCGLLTGRKFIKAPFLELSPNKTWEGFIGGGICTFIFAFFWPLVWVRFSWLVCPAQEITFIPFQNNLSCELDSVFLPATFTAPAVLGGMAITCLPVQLHAMVLALYASVFAPFGGFFASAIKRAYNKADFDSVLPGHGGLVDRFDCQFLMLLCTSVHLDTFVRSQHLTVGAMMLLIQSWTPEQQQELFNHLKKMLQKA